PPLSKSIGISRKPIWARWASPAATTMNWRLTSTGRTSRGRRVSRSTPAYPRQRPSTLWTVRIARFVDSSEVEGQWRSAVAAGNDQFTCRSVARQAASPDEDTRDVRVGDDLAAAPDVAPASCGQVYNDKAAPRCRQPTLLEHQFHL